MAIDAKTHQRYLDYREKHVYFGPNTKAKMLTMAEFEEADREHLMLDAKGDARDDEEEVRLEDLSALLFRD